MRKIIFIPFIFLLCHNGKSQVTKSLYDSTFTILSAMIEGKQPAEFKKAVFLVENSFLDGSMNYREFCSVIERYRQLSELLFYSRDLQYQESDKYSISVNAAVFTVMKDTIPIVLSEGKTGRTIPFGYDFEDISGDKSWTNMFVSKLLMTHKGNCHSLPYLYKILCEEFGAKAYLAYAPNHIYIKQHSKAFGWYNTELTSGMFPIDAWLMASGYIHLNAVQSGVYMDTLSQKQSIGACLVDLAMGYEKRFGVGDGSFILKACEKVLEHHPTNINALLLQAETRMSLWKVETTQTKEQKQDEFIEIQELYTHIHELGYRKMPMEMYLKWLISLKEEKDKYQNTRININFKQP